MRHLWGERLLPHVHPYVSRPGEKLAPCELPYPPDHQIGGTSMRQKVSQIPLPEQTGFHGYAANGRPIPRRGSRPHTQVQTVPPAASSYGQWVEDDFDTSDREYELPRMSTSARRYIQPGQYQQGNTRFYVKYAAPPQPAPQQPTTKKRRPVNTDEPVTESKGERGGIHWLVFMGLGMLVMLTLWAMGNLALNAYHTWQDDSRYGRPRTFQCDAVVGHNDSASNPSHFIALNLNRRVEIIEFPGGDATHARIFLGPTLIGDDQDLTPITLSFKDVNNDGKPDMLIHIQDQIVVFINDNGQFRPQKPGEHINL